MTLRVQHPGLYSTLQDQGRRGLRSLGIPWAGVGCEAWMHFANALLDQDRLTPVIETFEGGLSLSATDEVVWESIIGDVDAQILDTDGTTRQALPWQSHPLHPGDTLRLTRTGRYRSAVVGIKGLSINEHFGSVSTYPNASLGGLNGSPLSVGDELKLQTSTDSSCSPKALDEFTFPGEPQTHEPKRCYQIRAVLGPQDDAFTDESIKQFFSERFTVSTEIDRMGARLTGPTLKHRSAELKDLISDAILPGSVQVPGIGNPIVMLADAHTIGGYPKIATIVSADRALFSLIRPGDDIEFVSIDRAAGNAHTRTLAEKIDKAIDNIQDVGASSLSTERLLGLNLIGGVTDALDTE